MTITELIAQLEALRARHGDLTVIVQDTEGYGDYTDASAVRAVGMWPINEARTIYGNGGKPTGEHFIAAIVTGRVRQVERP